MPPFCLIKMPVGNFILSLTYELYILSSKMLVPPKLLNFPKNEMSPWTQYDSGCFVYS